jgi:NAD(P)-dependent dehydrogenase (short-subunit alcohol dehydrogenase family)
VTQSEKPVALVTGAARGIGRGIAAGLARQGLAVVINSVSEPRAGTVGPAQTLRTEIEKAGGTALTVRADISRAADRQRLLDATLEHFGRLDLLINNAGIAPARRCDILDADEESFDRLMSVNLKGPYFLTQAAARVMIGLRQRGVIAKGRICFVTSISAYTSSTSRGEYCVSKAGLSMAAKLWADRLAEFDMPVLEVRPGVMATDMTAGVKEKYDRLIAQGLLPLKRWGQPEDVARVVGAFARGDLDYSTGVAIDVSGGFQLRRL